MLVVSHRYHYLVCRIRRSPPANHERLARLAGRAIEVNGPVVDVVDHDDGLPTIRPRGGKEVCAAAGVGECRGIGKRAAELDCPSGRSGQRCGYPGSTTTACRS